MPTPGKPFDMFAKEEAACKTYAQGQIAGAVDQANTNAVGATLLTAGLGAGLGAAIGGGEGAGVGAASGAVVGTGVGANNAAAAQMTIQQRYDAAYSQCMYSKGNQVPGFEMIPPAAAAATAPVATPVSAPAPRFDPALVMAIQTELGRIGLLSGTPDGAMGPKTRAAIRDYQKMRGLSDDGKPTQSLLADIKKN